MESNQTNKQEEADGQPEKKQRKRISVVKKGVPVLPDPTEFRANKCSDRARMIYTGSQDFHYELWIDQHYHIREQLGDDDGKRVGIEPKTVEGLIVRAFKHLLLYSAFTKGFTFLNHGQKPPVRVL